MTYSVSASGLKDEVIKAATDALTAQSHPEVVPVVEALINAQPGEHVSLSASGSCYATDGKVGGSGTFNVSSDTPD